MTLSASRVLCGIAAVGLSFAAVEAQAVAIVAAKHDNVNHSATTSAFFTLSTDGTTTVAGENGWAPIAPTQAAVATSVTTKKTFSFVGNSTSGGNWTDGNGVPAGVTLTFDAQFTITALPTGSYLTNPGPNATVSNAIGRGIGVTQTFGPTGINDINLGAGLEFSPVTVSNVSFSGALTEAGFSFTPGGVSGFGTMLYRSNNFAEATQGMLLTQGADTIGFGTATGSIASGLLMENNFGQYAGSTPSGASSSAFPRQSGPYTLVVTQGAGVIKGLTLGYDVTYDITAGSAVNADFNNDDVVDGNDFLIWQRNLGAGSATLAQGDADGNATVDAADLAAWKNSFGTTGVTAAVAAVPEPATVALAAMMALSLVGMRKRA